MNTIDLELLIYDMYPEFHDVNFPIEILIQKFAEDESEFKHFMDDLINSIDVGVSPLTKTRFKGFAKDGIFLAKVEVD